MNKYYEEDLLDISNCIKQLNLTNATIFVTGACGMIGQTLINGVLLNNPNIKIIACDLSKEIFDKTYSDQRVSFANINDHVDKLLDVKFTHLIHLACPTSSTYFVNNPVETIDSIYSLTKKMLILTKKQNASMVYVSSMEAFGQVYDEKRSDENNLGYIPLNSTRSSYSEGKRIAELMCHAYAKEYNVNVKIARLAQTFGSGTNIEKDTRIFAYIAKCIIKGEDIKLATDGKSYGNYCYLSDTIRGILYTLAKGNIGEAYNVVNEKCTFTIYDMAKNVSKKLSSKNIDVLTNTGSASIYPKNTYLKINGQKLYSLGFTPKYDIYEMFKRMMNN